MSAKLVFDLGGVAIAWTPRDFIVDLCPSETASLHTESVRDAVLHAVFQHFEPDSDWAAFDCDKISSEQLAINIAMRIRSMFMEWPGSSLTVLKWIESLPDRLEPIEATLIWLKELRAAKIPLYFLSNMPKPFLKTLISHQQLFENFDDGIFSCDPGIAKPQAEIFRLASKQFSLNVSDNVIFIDDNVTNVEAARKFGWHAIHHLSVQQSRQALRQFI